jgi:hypothetical protein
VASDELTQEIAQHAEELRAEVVRLKGELGETQVREQRFVKTLFQNGTLHTLVTVENCPRCHFQPEAGREDGFAFYHDCEKEPYCESKTVHWTLDAWQQRFKELTEKKAPEVSLCPLCRKKPTLSRNTPDPWGVSHMCKLSTEAPALGMWNGTVEAWEARNAVLKKRLSLVNEVVPKPPEETLPLCPLCQKGTSTITYPTAKHVLVSHVCKRLGNWSGTQEEWERFVEVVGSCYRAQDLKSWDSQIAVTLDLPRCPLCYEHPATADSDFSEESNLRHQCYVGGYYAGTWTGQPEDWRRYCMGYGVGDK